MEMHVRTIHIYGLYTRTVVDRAQKSSHGAGGGGVVAVDDNPALPCRAAEGTSTRRPIRYKALLPCNPRCGTGRDRNGSKRL